MSDPILGPNGWECDNTTTAIPVAVRNPSTGRMTFSVGADTFLATKTAISSALDAPGTIPGLALWLDAADTMYTASYAAKVQNSGDVVGVWPDKSGNAVALTVSGSPLFNPTGLNGKPAVNFGGNSYFSKTGFFTSAFDSAYTAFVVSSQTGGAALGCTFGSTGGAQTLWHQQDDSAKQFALRMSGVTATGKLFSYLNADQIQMSHFDGVNLTIQADRFCGGNGSTSSTTGAASASATGTASMNGLNLGIGALSDGTFKFSGMISEVIIYQRALSVDERANVLAYLNRKWGFSRRLIVAEGDSLTSGTGSSGGATQAVSPSGTNYPARLWNALGSTAWDMRIDAYPGRNLMQMLSEASISDALAPNSTAAPVALVWALANTLSMLKSSGATTQLLQRYCLARKLSGFKVAVFTCLPRGDAVYAGFESDRVIVNAFVRANWPKFADALVDVAADSRLQNTADTTYFAVADHTHLTDAGYIVVASIASQSIAGL